MRALPSLVFVPAHQGHRVAAAGIGNRNAGIRGRSEGSRDPWNHLEGDALFVKKQRFNAALIEEERVAPFESRDQFVFCRLLRDQIANGFLIRPLGCRAADVDPFGVWRRQRQ